MSDSSAPIDLVPVILNELRAHIADLSGKFTRLDVKIDGLREDLSSDIESLREDMDSRFDGVQAALMDNAAHRKTTNQYVMTTSERHETDIADLRARVTKLEAEADKEKR
ncbi:MAG TPA: hypothetical protein VGM39_12005 [Kofleriaceae bacterium]|jgi:outer membrane murein-binding lipoprotein Lpp